MSLGSTKSKVYSKLYFNVEGRRPIILLLYFDDLFLIDENEFIVDEKKRLVAKFKMKDIGMMHYVLGTEVWKCADGIFLGQGKYVVEIHNGGIQENVHTYGIEIEASM